MRFDVITLFDDWVNTLSQQGVVGRALQEQLQLKTWNPREFTRDRHNTVDDRPYGGGPGMVMQYQPLYDCLQAVRQDQNEAGRRLVVYCSPQGQVFDHQASRALAEYDAITLIAGRYEGIDERFIQHHVDVEYSIGDYVLSGGELPAMVMIDAVVRGLPGVLGDAESAEQDSFVNGLLDYPHYTRPEQLVIDGRVSQVPTVLLSGNHEKIRAWRDEQAKSRTRERRPDLWSLAQLTKQVSTE